MRFTERARRAAAPIWQAVLQHPAVLGIGEGSLPQKRFREFIAQDYLFLVQYARALSLAVAKAEDLPAMRQLSALLHATLHTEMEFHRDFSARAGIAARELEQAEPTPTTLGYTSYLVQVAYTHGLPEIAAALLPCEYGYYEIGRRLKGRGGESPVYKEWIGVYSSREYAQLARELRALVDDLAAGSGEAPLRLMQRLYLTSCRWELRFWDMVSQGEAW